MNKLLLSIILTLSSLSVFASEISVTSTPNETCAALILHKMRALQGESSDRPEVINIASSMTSSMNANVIVVTEYEFIFPDAKYNAICYTTSSEIKNISVTSGNDMYEFVNGVWVKI